MATIERILTVCQLGVRFRHDQPASVLPLRSDVSQKIGEQFCFASIAAVGEVRWEAQSGTLPGGGTHVNWARGDLRNLTASVEGDSAAAEKAVRALWAALRSHAPQPTLGEYRPPEDISAAGVLLPGTTAVVRLPIGWEGLFPVARDLAADARKRMPKMLPGRESPVYSLSFRVVFLADNTPMTGKFTLEPRAETALEDRVFYTESPLDSTAHFAMLEGLCARHAH